MWLDWDGVGRTVKGGLGFGKVIFAVLEDTSNERIPITISIQLLVPSVIQMPIQYLPQLRTSCMSA